MLLQKIVKGTICYPGGTPAILEEFSFSFLQMCMYTQMYHCSSAERIHIDRAKTSYHAKARNELCENMMGDWIFMVDTDHQPEPDLCIRMLKMMYKYDVQVLAGLYQIKRWPYTPLIMMFNEDKSGFEMIAKFDTNAEIFKIDAAGAGCLLIRRTALVRVLLETGELPFTIIPPFSEDFSFFKRLSDIGIDAYCCPAIENPHLITIPITMDWCDIDTSKREERETVGLIK